MHWLTSLRLMKECKKTEYITLKGNESMSKLKKPLGTRDVVKIMHPEAFSRTGVINRVCEKTGMVNVFQKNTDIGIWFDEKYLKRIGRIR
jgi:hypothetical protein